MSRPSERATVSPRAPKTRRRRFEPILRWLRRRHRNFRPGPEDRIPTREHAVAVNLSRGDEDGVVEAVADETGL